MVLISAALGERAGALTPLKCTGGSPTRLGFDGRLVNVEPLVEASEVLGETLLKVDPKLLRIDCLLT